MTWLRRALIAAAAQDGVRAADLERAVRAHAAESFADTRTAAAWIREETDERIQAEQQESAARARAEVEREHDELVEAEMRERERQNPGKTRREIIQDLMAKAMAGQAA
jgi:glutamyl-tRNA reductase